MERIQPEPIHTVILTHGHLDHAMGILGIERIYRGRPRQSATTMRPERDHTDTVDGLRPANAQRALPPCR